MTPEILDAAKLITVGGTAIFIVVQLVKAYGYTSPRATIATAVLFAAALTALYAASNGFFAIQYAFDLVIAAITIAAAGAGINSAAHATLRG